MKVYIENISKKKAKIGDQYIKLLILNFLQKTIPPDFLDLCFKNPNKPQFLPSEVKVALKN